MKRSLIATALLVVSGNVFAATDYAHCMKQFNSMAIPDKGIAPGSGIYPNAPLAKMEKTDGASYYPFELTADGKIKPHPTINYKNENGKETLTTKKDSILGNSIITINRDEKGELTNVVSINHIDMEGFYGGMGGMYPSDNAKAKKKKVSFDRKNETTVKLEIKNGKCVPSRMDTVASYGDEARQDVTFDLKLCRNVSQFFKKNPEAASCFDKKLMDKAQAVFDGYYDDNKDIYGEIDKDSFMKPTPQKTKLKGLNGGSYGYPGMGMGLGMGGMYPGMTGMSSSAMLQPFMPTVDTMLSSTTYTGMNGYGSSPVITAMQLMSLCNGGGFGPKINPAIDDESVWIEGSESVMKGNEKADGVAK
jgi:hypothetical protein